METVSDYSLVRERIDGLPRPSVVAIEGFVSSGKSYLAKELATDLSATVFHTDEGIAERDKSLPYTQRVDQQLLRKVIDRGVERRTLIVVEGICLRETLRGSNISADLFVYVKRLTKNGLWHDGINLEDFETEGTDGLPEPERSNVNYHVRERPHELASVAYHRIEA